MQCCMHADQTGVTISVVSTSKGADCFNDIQVEADTVTPTHTIPEVSSLPCTIIPPLNSSSVQNAAPISRPNPGVVAAIALGTVLVIVIMACAVAWLVSLNRKKVNLKREGSGRLHEHDYVFVQFPTGNVWYVKLYWPIASCSPFRS